jgi:alpha,alpha-trehalose phosphorylase
VNNNLFTNVMARYNLEQAVAAVELMRREHPRDFGQMQARLKLGDEEVAEWARCAKGMHIPFDEGLGIHPQDDFFLEREVWDLPNTPAELRPLMLHYHPLVIYRFQVLKQADVVLALFLQGDRFTLEEKRADFEYYDPITTGDSTLSAVVQSIIAAEVGFHEVALRYFHDALYVDLMNLHGNTVDGMHIASTGGVWSALVFGFGGMRDHGTLADGGTLSFDPRLPESWSSLAFKVQWRGTRLQVRITEERIALMVDDGPGPVPVTIRGTRYVVAAGEPLVVELAHHGPRASGHVDSAPMTGGTRPDGSRITAAVPEPSLGPTTEELQIPFYQPDQL